MSAIHPQAVALADDIQRLGDTAMAIKARRDRYEATLRDIIAGAELLLAPPFTLPGAGGAFAREVLRIARAALECAP